MSYGIYVRDTDNIANDEEGKPMVYAGEDQANTQCAKLNGAGGQFVVRFVPQANVTKIQADSACAQGLVYSNDYYVSTYKANLTKNEMTKDGVEKHQYDDRKLVLMFHLLWESLPDNMAIHRTPFYQICDIAENIFDSGVTGIELEDSCGDTDI